MCITAMINHTFISAVTGWFQNSSDWRISIPHFYPSAVRCRTALLLLYFLIVGINAS